MVNAKIKRIIIAAVSQNGIIGNGINVPWKVDAELEHFKSTTNGHPILFGRKTFDSIGKTLTNRLNIVITKNPHKNKSLENLIFFKSVYAAYNYLKKNKHEKVFICGGGRIYKNTIKHAEEMIISFMNFEVYGNVKFPRINLDLWQIKSQNMYDDFKVIHYVRIKKLD